MDGDGRSTMRHRGNSLASRRPANEIDVDWRAVSSAVGAVKAAYRGASKGQRAQMRAWMRRVLTGEDGNE